MPGSNLIILAIFNNIKRNGGRCISTGETSQYCYLYSRMGLAKHWVLRVTKGKTLHQCGSSSHKEGFHMELYPLIYVALATSIISLLLTSYLAWRNSRWLLIHDAHTRNIWRTHLVSDHGCRKDIMPVLEHEKLIQTKT